MKIHQLSLFLENRPSALVQPCQALAKAGINIVTMSLADTQQFGILRLIVKDWQKAKTVLEQAGSVVNATEVIAVEVEDRPGVMADILAVIDRCHLDIEYMYAFTFRRGDKAVLVFRFDNPAAAVEALQKNGVNLVNSIELFKNEN